jgi:hypothetical protein
MGFGLVVGFIALLHSSLLHRSLEDTLSLSLLESSLAIVQWWLPAAVFPLPLGSQTVPGLSYSNSQLTDALTD